MAIGSKEDFRLLEGAGSEVEAETLWEPPIVRKTFPIIPAFSGAKSLTIRVEEFRVLPFWVLNY